MRLTILLLTVGFLNVSASSFSQKINYYGKNVSFETVFSTIQKETGYLFMYKDGELNDAGLVTIKATNESIEDFLERLFYNQPFDYSVSGKSIFIARKPMSPLAKREDPLNTLVLEHLKAVGIQIFVLDEDLKPLSGASVELVGSKKMHLTDAKGTLSLNAEENSIIKVSYVGYVSKEMKITAAHLSAKSVMVYMKKSDKTLDETQIIAYGKTTKRFATGSIGTVKAEEIARQPVMNVLQALEGKVPGLVITPATGNSAAPIKVEIRGRNSLNPNVLSEPLYVVDGMPLAALQVGMFYGQNSNTGSVQAGRTNNSGESPLLYMNPRDIESIDVLKDADATAIYGARGANGVILITTKRSKSGPTRFDMDIKRGSVTIPRKLDLMGTEEYLAVRREAFRNDGIIPTIYNAPDLMLWDQNKYTDWQKEFYKPGSQTSVDASISGGMSQTNYRISASYQTQDELNNNGGKNMRANLGGNITHTSVNQKFQFDFSSQLAISNVDAIAAANYTLTAPNAPEIYNIKGEFNFEPYRGQFSSNFPFSNLMRPSESRTNTVTNRLNVRYEVIKGLNLSVAGSYIFAGNENATFQPIASSDPLFNPLSMAFFGKATTTNWSVEPQVSYNTFIGKGNLSVQLGGSLQHVRNEGLTLLSNSFPDDNLIRSPNNAAVTTAFDGSGEYKFNAGFAIINYRWDNKYVVNLSGRRDGSSKFGSGNQFGNFGSVGLAWISSEEKWMKQIMPSWFSFLKFAGSYGTTGSDAVGDYEYLTRWGSSVALNTPRKLIGYNGIPVVHMMTHTNKNFRWESTDKFNVSASLGFFDDRINIEATYYQSRSGNQLTQIGTPFYTGFANVRANWDAIVQNSGMEFTVSARFLNTKDWTVSGNFNIGKNMNKLIDFPGLAFSPYANMYEVGKSMRLMYLLKYTGIHPMTGDYTFEDHNKDGTVYFPNGTAVRDNPSDDRYIVYDLADKFNGGMGVHLSYKSFGIYTGFVFKKALARDPFLNLPIGLMNNIYIPQEVKDNHWKQPGDIAKYPKYTTTTLDPRLGSSDAAYQNASFLQMNNLALSYDLPKKFIHRIKMKGCRFSVNTQNIFTITSFKGIDPRITSMVGGTPTPRIISSSLSFNF